MAAGESMEVVPGKFWGGFSIGMCVRHARCSLHPVKASSVGYSSLLAIWERKSEPSTSETKSVSVYSHLLQKKRAVMDSWRFLLTRSVTTRSKFRGGIFFTGSFQSRT